MEGFPEEVILELRFFFFIVRKEELKKDIPSKGENSKLKSPEVERRA